MNNVKAHILYNVQTFKGLRLTASWKAVWYYLYENSVPKSQCRLSAIRFDSNHRGEWEGNHTPSHWENPEKNIQAHTVGNHPHCLTAMTRSIRLGGSNPEVWPAHLSTCVPKKGAQCQSMLIMMSHGPRANNFACAQFLRMCHAIIIQTEQQWEKGHIAP